MHACSLPKADADLVTGILARYTADAELAAAGAVKEPAGGATSQASPLMAQSAADAGRRPLEESSRQRNAPLQKSRAKAAAQEPDKPQSGLSEAEKAEKKRAKKARQRSARAEAAAQQAPGKAEESTLAAEPEAISAGGAATASEGASKQQREAEKIFSAAGSGELHRLCHLDAYLGRDGTHKLLNYAHPCICHTAAAIALVRTLCILLRKPVSIACICGAE